MQELELYGHRSRVWQAIEANMTNPDDQDLIISVSEDATCKLWAKDKSQNKLPAYYTLKGHSSKNVRAVALHGNCLVTGGDDGGIKMYNIKAIQHQKKRLDQRQH